jgi:peptidoglycan-associated lipoprotein
MLIICNMMPLMPESEKEPAMTRNFTRLALLTSVGLVLSACGAKKKVELEAPPATAAPVQTTQTAQAGTGETIQAITSTIRPGSQDDLRDKAGTDTVLFGYDSYELDAEARGVLARHAEWLRANANVRITLEGHCDERGTREYNLALGDRRANSAKNFLAGQGVDVSRISTISYGKERPVADGGDDAAMARNRRAVTVVMGG